MKLMIFFNDGMGDYDVIEKERIENVKHEKNEFEVRNVKNEIHFFVFNIHKINGCGYENAYVATK